MTATSIDPRIETRVAAFEKRAPGPGWLQPMRRAAIERFAELGFPSTKLEDWRTTDVAPIAAAAFAPAGAGAPRIESGALPAGVRVGSLAAALGTERDLLEPHLAKHARLDGHPFVALNTALFEDGVLIVVPRGVTVDTPIRLEFAVQAGETHPRILVVAEEGSTVCIVESWTAAGAGDPAFANAVTEIVAGPGARVEHVKLLHESDAVLHVATVQASVGRDARFASLVVACGARLARNETNVVLHAPGAECALDGAFVLDDKQHADCRTFVDHASPHATSTQLYKGVLAGAARGAFNGRVLVRPDAQKTSARQTNRNLLLSETALVDTKPQLEIHADDVKCNHGASIGRLDADALFYLRARGIDPVAARRILTQAFVREAVERAPSAVRDSVDQLVVARLARIHALGGDA